MPIPTRRRKRLQQRLRRRRHRGLIQGGVNVACSRKKKALRNVRVSKRSWPVRPGSSYNVYQFELRDRCCVSLIIHLYHQSPVSQNSTILARRCEPLPEFPHFRRKFTSVFICFIRIRIRIDRPHAYRSNFSVNLIRLGALDISWWYPIFHGGNFAVGLCSGLDKSMQRNGN